MKLIWILFLILFDIAFKLAMIVLALYVIVAVGMGIYWMLFESGAGLLLLGATVLVIISFIASCITGDHRNPSE